MADLKNDAKLAAEEEGARVGVEVEAQTDFMTVLLEVPLPCLASPPPSPPVAEPAALRSATTQCGLTHIRPQHSGGHVSLVEAAMSTKKKSWGCGQGRVKKNKTKKMNQNTTPIQARRCPDPSARMRPNNCPGNPGSVVSGKPRQTPNAHIDLHPRDRHPQHSVPAVVTIQSSLHWVVW